MTPGFPFAAPGPTPGGGALASRQRCLPRRRLLRLAVPRSLCVCACRGTPCSPRYADPLRLPHALPECLRVPACPAVPGVPALLGGWIDPAERRACPEGRFARAVDSPQRTWRRIDPRFLDRRLRRLSRVPVFSLAHHALVYDPGGLRQVSPVATGRIRRSSGVRLAAVPTPTAQASWGGAPWRDHDFHTTFAARYRPC